MNNQKLYNEVLINPMLSEEQQEEKIIQLTDLIRFIESYKPSIEILDCSNYINIIKDDYINKGIFFCDYKLISNPQFYSTFLSQSYVEILKIKYNINELWYVFVDDKLNGDNSRINEFIIENQLTDFYDKVFLFDFFESHTSELN